MGWYTKAVVLNKSKFNDLVKSFFKFLKDLASDEGPEAIRGDPLYFVKVFFFEEVLGQEDADYFVFETPRGLVKLDKAGQIFHIIRNEYGDDWLDDVIKEEKTPPRNLSLREEIEEINRVALRIMNLEKEGRNEGLKIEETGGKYKLILKANLYKGSGKCWVATVNENGKILNFAKPESVSKDGYKITKLYLLPDGNYLSCEEGTKSYDHKEYFKIVNGEKVEWNPFKK